MIHQGNVGRRQPESGMATLTTAEDFFDLVHTVPRMHVWFAALCPRKELRDAPPRLVRESNQ